MTKLLKKIWIIITFAVITTTNIPCHTFAAEEDIEVDWFNIIPEIEDTTDINKHIKEIWESWWNVRKKYNEVASSADFSTSEQISSWIMNWDTIMNYLVFIVQFLSQLGLVVWAVFIMIAWYKYAVSLFQWWKVPSSTVKNAIIGIFIVIFSYAIMRILTSFIWLT